MHLKTSLQDQCLRHNNCSKMSVNKSKTIKDAYKAYAKENKNDPDFAVDYTTYRKVCLAFNAKISESIILNAAEFKLYGGLGSIRIKKMKASKTQKRVDWERTKESNIKVYHLNFHTDEHYYRWHWNRHKSRFKNRSAYSFTPIRKNKRELAKLLKENSVDYFN